MTAVSQWFGLIARPYCTDSLGHPTDGCVAGNRGKVCSLSYFRTLDLRSVRKKVQVERSWRAVQSPKMSPKFTASGNTISRKYMATCLVLPPSDDSLKRSYCDLPPD